MPARVFNVFLGIRSLSVRIMALMTVAMLPVGLIAVYQTRVVIDNAREINRAALISQIRAEAAREKELIDHALAAAQGLAVLVSKLDESNCNEIMRGFVEGNENYIFAGFIRTSGQLACSSTGEEMDLSNRPAFRVALQRKGVTVQLNPSGAVTGRDVVLVTQPVWGGGEIVGYVSLSIPHSVVMDKMNNPAPEGELRLIAVDSEGRPIAATLGLETAPSYLPRDMDPGDLVARQGETFLARAGSGEQRYFAVTPMIDRQVLLVGSWPLSGVPKSDGQWQPFLATLLPVLMWAAGVGVALFGMQRLVVRHVAELRSAMRRFALGERDEIVLEMEDPPVELEEAQRAFNRMALLIADGEKRREQDLKDKEVLLREVHHRVKNNLQLIASIMNMQARDLTTDEARHVVAELQRRVRGMAVLHRALYNTPSSTTVDAAALVRAVVSDVEDLNHGGQGRQVVVTDLSPVQLYPDQAVPLSLLVAETLHRATQEATRSGATGPVRVELTTSGAEMIRLTVQGPPAGPDLAQAAEQGSDGLAQKMISAFLRQLDGQMAASDADGCSSVSVTFPRADYGT